MDTEKTTNTTAESLNSSTHPTAEAVTDEEKDFISIINNAKNPEKAIEKAMELIELMLVFGWEFLNDGQPYVEARDKEGLNTHIERWKAKLQAKLTEGYTVEALREELKRREQRSQT